MLADPQTLKISATNSTTGGTSVAVNLVINDGLTSEFVSSDGTKRLRVSHEFTKGRPGIYPRARRLVGIDVNGSVTDPITGLSSNQSFSVHFVINEPVTSNNVLGQGLFSDPTIKDTIAALIAELLVTGLQDAVLSGQH